jgi:prepilin-type N-terminal cleavage/methylation domain-containing protein
MTNTFLQSALLRAQAKKKGKKNGFTLIELMVVVAIVGVLSAVGVPQLLKAQDKAKDSAAIATLTNAAKECSLVLVTEGGDGTNFDIANYSTANQAVTGTCAVDTADALQIISEASGARTASVDFDAGGIPTPAVFADATDDTTGGDTTGGDTTGGDTTGG